jgi:hypothetical protein
MPRFGTKALLVIFAVAAAWLSTFSGYWAAQDVRRSILLLILVSSAALAMYSRGRRRAFWSAFAFVMFFCGGISYERLLYRYVPDFLWIESLQTSIAPGSSPNYYAPVSPYVVQPAPTPAPSPPNPAQPSPPMLAPPLVPPTPTPPVYQVAPAIAGLTIGEALSDTLAAAWTIALAAIADFIAAYIFSQQANPAR